MSDQIRFRAIINSGDATGEHDGGTSIMVTIPDGLADWQKVDYITGRVAAEVSRYLAFECLVALEAGKKRRAALFAPEQPPVRVTTFDEGCGGPVSSPNHP